MKATIFLTAALLALARAALDLFGTSFYAFEHVPDYLVVVLMTAALSVTAAALG